jgi:hypothetical protein
VREVRRCALSTQFGEVGGVNVSVFASPDGPRVQIFMVGQPTAKLSLAEVRELQRLLRAASSAIPAVGP